MTWWTLGLPLMLLGFYLLGKRDGLKTERERTQALWYCWFQGVRSYTLNQFAGALTDNEHHLSRDEMVKTARYLDVTAPREPKESRKP